MSRRLGAIAALMLLWPLLAILASPAHAAVPLCFGKTPTVVLTDGNDSYEATNTKPQVIWGGGGDDYISGPDPYEFGPATWLPGVLICGGPGNDRLWGGNGNDKINGGGGADVITDWQGADLLQGNAGDDRVVDKSCEDCGGGQDVLRGQGGNDVLVNAWGHDKVYGGAGADDLADIECDATYLDGGPGADYIESYHGSYEGMNCDSQDQYGNPIPGPADTVVGGTELDRAILSYADKITGVERYSYADPCGWYC